MKKLFEKPEYEYIELNGEDIITTSIICANPPQTDEHCDID